MQVQQGGGHGAETSLRASAAGFGKALQRLSGYRSSLPGSAESHGWLPQLTALSETVFLPSVALDYTCFGSRNPCGGSQVPLSQRLPRCVPFPWLLWAQCPCTMHTAQSYHQWVPKEEICAPMELTTSKESHQRVGQESRHFPCSWEVFKSDPMAESCKVICQPRIGHEPEPEPEPKG